jgi:nitrilase
MRLFYGKMTMRVSVIQMSPGHQKSANIAQAQRLISATAADKPGLIGLPELWSCLGGGRSAKFDEAEELPAVGSNGAGGLAYEFLRDVAVGLGIVVHGGSIGERGTGVDSGRLFNTTVVFGPDGIELARYRKIHLFDITTPNGTGYRESAAYGAGDKLVCYQSGTLRVGCAICYDLRFGDMFQELRASGAELIMVPSAFTVATGRAHWEVLIRARAIETQCWIAAPATCGEHIDARGEARATFGHSMICDPWGRIMGDLADGVGSISASIDSAITKKIRGDMPVMEHRASRPELSFSRMTLSGAQGCAV